MVHLCCYFDWHYIDREHKFDTACPVCYPPQPLLEELIGPSFPYPLPEITMLESLRVWEDLFQDFYKNANFTNEQTFMRSLTIQRNFQVFIDYFLNSQLKEQQIPDRRITHILEIMEHDLLHDIPKKIEVYYKSLRMSRAHFFELFRQSTACSPVQYMQRFRIGRAKEDLLHTTLTITEIAEKYHFSSVHYFSRLFHKVTGQSPAHYRSQHTEK
ncbi:helix-turn-helix domain-containing protein [Paenibacillus radicis (ex Gao et al. 2016)]|uniref:HTH araC/xylS-type domain-containing protein n=1 Tax=Paenibacillus radicis (ex Gao et al. 2016) TaxID=1737354 RepID=A0A917M182_9BACL|nr:helix-turn-helix transcriptional regulator [Paenibacillus radicis (ex Gao et al. 2016)]GGG68744.1 hypothetical protein GCM10010918_24670 [Paenibacillus radicis (ex Gao et al. 2016)]